jgi:IclR family transcriptional regulator, pca regulon regulatory protein
MTSTAKAAPQRKEAMAGLAKGLAIIEAFDTHTRLTVADAARAAGLTRPAARRCLLTLVEFGYLHHDGKFFTPLPRLLRLGFSYLSAAPLPKLAQPILDDLRDKTGESISLGILDGEDGIVFVARSTATRLVSTTVSLGIRLPLYCMAVGRLILAARSDVHNEALLSRIDLKRRTPKTLTSRVAIMRAIKEVRAKGFAIQDEELELGLLAIAAPVRNSRGETVGGIAVSTSSARMSVEQMVQKFLQPLQKSASLLGSVI